VPLGRKVRALFATTGHAAPEKVPTLAATLTVFVGGVLVAALASGATYLSQWFYANEASWTRKTGFVLNILAIVLGLGAYGVFAFGTWCACRVFASFAS
jgi:hypothetical protein